MQITGAGPAQQQQFDFDTKIEKQGTQDLQSGAPAASAQAPSAAEATNETAPVQASSESAQSNSEDRPASRERGLGGRLDVSV